MDLKDDISSLKGIGEKSAGLFHKVGVFSLMDLLRYYPSSYIRYPKIIKVKDARPEERVALELEVQSEASLRHVGGMSILSFTACDDTGLVSVTYFNSPYLKNAVKPGMKRVFFGSFGFKGQTARLSHPKMFKYEEYRELGNTLMPVYPLTKGLTARTVTKAVKAVFDAFGDLEDPLDEDVRNRLDLMSLRQSLYGMHFPVDEEGFIRARKRVVFDEFTDFLRSVRQLKEDNSKTSNHYVMIESAEAVRLTESLPFRLTGAQERAYRDIVSDLASPYAMNRLIEGDVGSGKTLVACLAMLTAVKNGYQAALMAPTEVLAGQHMAKLSELLKPYDVTCTLLTGAMSAKEKKQAREDIASGVSDIIIGTHALITDLVEYKNLALVITDEQHRFGVSQRKNLSDKAGGGMPHVLVMSATPIPRTLALILYGDLSITVIDEKPSKRLDIKNALVGPEYRKKAYEFIKKEVAAHHQAYVICPLVEPSEDESRAGENVEEYSKKLADMWKDDVRVGMLSGRMKSRDKNAVMERFASGDIDVLVSTTVVEVGVDVPNATVMMIENAERFGLAALHQLRGRIGRGDLQSYCIFVDTSGKKESSKRLEILKNTNDGFKIASKDLDIRGPGDIFGIRQSGELGFRVADIYTDAGILKMASEYVSSGDAGGEYDEAGEATIL